MISKKFLASLVAVFALAVLVIANVSALRVDSVEVSGVDFASSDSENIAVFAGETLPVRVIFSGDDNVTEDVRVKAWISGSRDYSVTTERFVVLGRANAYSRALSLQVPSNLDEIDEDLTLFVSVESRSGQLYTFKVNLVAQRESYKIQVLDAELKSEVIAGETLPIDVVLKNRGRQFAEDAFVRASITALNTEDRAYFGDLSSTDQSDPDKEDSVERRLFLSIPSNAPAGIYTIEIEAFSDESVTTLTKKVVVKGKGEESTVLAPTHVKSFSTSESGEYSLTIVNAGNKVQVYELIADAPEGLGVQIDEPVVAIPAGTSKTVKITADAEKAGKYSFSVNVHSGTAVVDKQEFTANVTGGAAAFAGNTTVLITVVLAIIFVVLLVVLIVLLTRKPQKSEEFGESYY